jgi:hypothetical protein
MRNRLAWIGSVITAIYLLGFTWFIFGRLPDLQIMPLNNVGDFLAGAFGPIAFFWLILGFMQQGTELRLSADALRMQADELKASVQQQTALVAAQQVSLENHERSLEPLLSLKYTGHTEIEGDFYSCFSLTNLGNYCESVYVRLDGVEMHPIGLEPLYKDVERAFLLNDMDEMSKKLFLEVHYKKLSGRENYQVFELSAFEDEDGPDIRIKKRPLKDLVATP